MKNNTKSTLNELTNIFEKIYLILMRENENNWIRGIEFILRRISLVDENSDPDLILKEISTSFDHMDAGAGSFSDFVIWRENFDEMRQLNKEFSELKTRAWRLLRF